MGTEKKHKIQAGKRVFFFCRYVCNNEEIFLVKPTTYMNRSGFAVREVTEIFGIDIYDTVIVSDDYNLELGQ
ncbi:aminoacyl-tRNA hydrolase, partial [candidate division WOR-3 bacterium]|nr:aminoacyl-tRNA hydrolase [candidate division WOR-3 bacterium]